MKIKDVKRNKSNYGKIDTEENVENYIEKPLINPMKELRKKNIITIMSSANEINAVWLDDDGNNMYETKKDFDAVKYSYGEGYAYIMFDYDSLSQENKKKMAELYDELNEDEPKQSYDVNINYEQSYRGNKKVIYAIHQKEHIGQSWKIDSNATYDSLTKKPQNEEEREFYERRDFVYTTPYTERSVIIRYPINEETEDFEVEEYFNGICDRLSAQEKYVSYDEIFKSLNLYKTDDSSLKEFLRSLTYLKKWNTIYEPYTGKQLFTQKQKEEIISEYKKMKKG